MTLSQVIAAIEGIAAKQPAVKMIVRNDVFRISSVPDARYGAFAWLQGQHSGEVDSSLASWNFTLFYVDRLTQDEGNRIEVQSVGIEVLTNIIRALGEVGIYAESYTFNTFNQRFEDECAGVFANVTFRTLVGTLCPESYTIAADKGAFNLSFNISYDIALGGEEEVKII